MFLFKIFAAMFAKRSRTCQRRRVIPRVECLEERALLHAGVHPLTDLPVLHSFAGAPAALYLDFDGHDLDEDEWGDYTPGLTPAFDLDGDATTFSHDELDAITEIWQQVTEDYAPFNIDVTTEEPGSFADGVALRVAFGGSSGGAGDWHPRDIFGTALLDSFTSASSPNVVYVFTVNCRTNTQMAKAASHEAGHAFGLEHYPDRAADRFPIMKQGSVSRSRTTWFQGVNEDGDDQDDMAILAGATNGFDYRPDDHGNTARSATRLRPFEGNVAAAGIIETMDDLDYFAFQAMGQIHLEVNVARRAPNLDVRIELRDSRDNLIAWADPENRLSAVIDADVRLGDYRLVVMSHGVYGDVGQYTVSGNVGALRISPQQRLDPWAPVLWPQERVNWSPNGTEVALGPTLPSLLGPRIDPPKQVAFSSSPKSLAGSTRLTDLRAVDQAFSSSLKKGRSPFTALRSPLTTARDAAFAGLAFD